MDARILFVISAIETDLHKHLDLSDLAQSVNLSSSRLRHLFKAEKGMTLSKYLRGARLQRSRMLLVTTFLSVKEVMNQVGFSDDSHFNHEFKKAFGLSPTSCRTNLISTPSPS